jgi:predicted metal-dependent phosphoesterase TrpH
MKFMIDLHCHTTASDGILTPENLVKRAKKEGIKILAIADHDTVAGIDEAMVVAKAHNITLIPAIELSLDCPTGDLHLLAYNIDHHNQHFINIIHKLKSAREKRIQKIVHKLNKININLTVEDVKKECDGAAAGKPHVARALIKKNLASDIDSAIKKYLLKGKPAYVPKEKLDMETAFKLLENVGGLPVLAHPKSMNCHDEKKFKKILESFICYGLAGIEVYASMHDDAQVKHYSDIARRYNLIMTGGSDFHGDKADRLGYYGQNRKIPLTCADPL